MSDYGYDHALEGSDPLEFFESLGPEVLAATAIAFLDAFRLNHINEIEPISRRLLKRLVTEAEQEHPSIQWDVFQNEAEQAYPDEPDRRLIDATSDRVVRQLLWGWAEDNWDDIARGDLGVAIAALSPDLLEPAVAIDLTRYSQATADGVSEAVRPYLPCSESLCRTDPTAAVIAMQLWRALSPASPVSQAAANSSMQAAPVPHAPPQIVSAKQATNEDDPPVVRLAGRSAQQRGDALEVATQAVLALLFDLGADGAEVEIRRQHSGTQLGTDFKVRAPALKTGSWCYVECKNYKNAPKPDDIGGKLLQTQTYLGDRTLDHWILVSPHSDPSNDLDQLVEATNDMRTFAFAVQVWSPSTGVEELFSLVPEAYETVYGRPPDPVIDPEAVLTKFRSRLKPLRRLPPGLGGYLERPESFVVSDERRWIRSGADLLPRTGVDEAGEAYPGDLRDRVIGELVGDRPRTVLLLADFGEGKSCFTVTLCDRLRRLYRRDANARAFPIRFLLRDFRHSNNAAAFLGQQLAKLGSSEAELDQLRSVAQPVIILDGLDEMSVRQDPKTLRDNLMKIGDLLELLDGLSVLVTTRPQFFLTGHDRTLFEDRLRHPLIVHLQQLRRRDVVQNLRQHAREQGLEAKLARVKNLYDPIGLAGKALFLDMLKAALPDLPEDHFDERVLYETYVLKTFQRKPGLLADPDHRRTEAQILEDLLILLEEVALEVHRNGEGAVSLRRFLERAGGAAHRLWRLSEADDAADDDAAARIGTRSVLRRVADDDRWLVDFAHRSLKEYFVARALARATTDKDPFASLRTILKDAPVQREVIDFYRLLVSPEDGAEVLTRVARSAGVNDGTLVGAGALSLLHSVGGQLRGRNWSEIGLDGAVLRSADLSGSDLRGSTLRNADLSSALLSNADLRNVDLTGANLGVNDTIVDATGDQRSGCVYTLSDSGSVGRVTATTRVIEDIGHVEMRSRPRSLVVVAEDLLCIAGESEVVLARVDGGEIRPLSTFLIRNDILRLGMLNDGTLAILSRAEGSAFHEFDYQRITLIDLHLGQVVGQSSVLDQAVCTAAGTRDAWLVPSAGHLVLYWHGSQHQITLGDRLESALFRSRGETVDVLLGTDSGFAAHVEIDSEGRANHLSNLGIALGRITSLASDGDLIVAVSTDGTIGLGSWTDEGVGSVGGAFFRGVRADGALVSGVRSLEEREALLAGGATELDAHT